MSTTLARNNDLEIVEAFNGFYIYRISNGDCRGMGSEHITEVEAAFMIRDGYNYAETLEAYFGEEHPDDGS